MAGGHQTGGIQGSDTVGNTLFGHCDTASRVNCIDRDVGGTVKSHAVDGAGSDQLVSSVSVQRGGGRSSVTGRVDRDVRSDLRTRQVRQVGDQQSAAGDDTTLGIGCNDTGLCTSGTNASQCQGAGDVTRTVEGNFPGSVACDRDQASGRQFVSRTGIVLSDDGFDESAVGGRARSRASRVREDDIGNAIVGGCHDVHRRGSEFTRQGQNALNSKRSHLRFLKLSKEGLMGFFDDPPLDVVF